MAFQIFKCSDTLFFVCVCAWWIINWGLHTGFASYSWILISKLQLDLSQGKVKGIPNKTIIYPSVNIHWYLLLNLLPLSRVNSEWALCFYVKCCRFVLFLSWLLLGACMHVYVLMNALHALIFLVYPCCQIFQCSITPYMDWPTCMCRRLFTFSVRC